MGGAAALQRVPNQPIVVAAGLDARRAARVIDALRDRAVLWIVSSLAALQTFLRGSTEPVDVVVIPARDDSGRDVADFVRELATAWPRMAIVVYCEIVSVEAPDIRSLAVAGAHQFVFAGVDDSALTLRGILDSARREVASEFLMLQLATVLPSELHPLAERVLARPDVVTTVPALAAALGVHRKTVFNRCARAGSLTPSELVTWIRLVMVAYLLETTGRTVERIAVDLGFASDTSLRNLLKRYSGHRAGDIRESGGARLVMDALAARTRAQSGVQPYSSIS